MFIVTAVKFSGTGSLQSPEDTVVQQLQSSMEGTSLVPAENCIPISSDGKDNNPQAVLPSDANYGEFFLL